MVFKIFKKIYYNKYTKKSHSISNVDLIIDRIFSKKKMVFISTLVVIIQLNITTHIYFTRKDGME